MINPKWAHKFKFRVTVGFKTEEERDEWVKNNREPLETEWYPVRGSLQDEVQKIINKQPFVIIGE